MAKHCDPDCAIATFQASFGRQAPRQYRGQKFRQESPGEPGTFHIWAVPSPAAEERTPIRTARSVGAKTRWNDELASCYWSHSAQSIKHGQTLPQSTQDRLPTLRTPSTPITREVIAAFSTMKWILSFLITFPVVPDTADDEDQEAYQDGFPLRVRILPRLQRVTHPPKHDDNKSQRCGYASGAHCSAFHFSLRERRLPRSILPPLPYWPK